jgi:MOSC domain-containing protein YiiM
MENRPCHLVSKEIEARIRVSARRSNRRPAGRRGVTAWVEREGEIRLGAKLRLHIPDQPHWPHAGRRDRR